jgi:hypothetical protein
MESTKGKWLSLSGPKLLNAEYAKNNRQERKEDQQQRSLLNLLWCDKLV